MTKRGSMQVDRLLGQLKRLPNVMDGLMVPQMKRQARLLISSSGKVRGLSQITPPFRADLIQDPPSRALDRGKQAVARNIRRVYGGPSELYDRIRERDPGAARAFWLILKAQRDPIRASAFAQHYTGLKLEVFDDGAKHKERRSHRGRVWGMRPSMYVFNEVWVKRYIVQRQANVGLLASTLVGPGEQRFGRMSGVAEFVRRHSNSWGDVTLTTTGVDGIQARVTATVPYNGIALQRLFTYALKHRLRAFRLELPNILRHAVKQAGFTA